MTRRPMLAAAAFLASAALLGAGAALPAPAAAPAAAWGGDTVHSFVTFRVKHMGTSWAYGRFNDFTVAATADEGGALVSSVNFTVKTESVDTGNPKRDQHLKSPDFFNAKQFAEITFASTAVKAIDGDTAEVTGNLTLHGTTKPVTVTVMKVGTGKGMKGEDLLGLETSFAVKRSDFGMSNMVGPVGDEARITVAVELSKK